MARCGKIQYKCQFEQTDRHKLAVWSLDHTFSNTDLCVRQFFFNSCRRGILVLPWRDQS